jgi:hypothetical protein
MVKTFSLAILAAIVSGGCIVAPNHDASGDGGGSTGSGASPDSGSSHTIHIAPPTPPCAQFDCGGQSPGFKPAPYVPTCDADATCVPDGTNGTACGGGHRDCNAGQCCSVVAVCRNLFGSPVMCPDHCTDSKSDVIPCPLCQPTTGCICMVGIQVVECPQETSVDP